LETIQDLGSYTFKALLRNSVTKFADSDALSLIDGKPVTYRELDKNVTALAKLLHALNLGRGSKIALFGNGRPEWGTAYFAVVNYGGIAVPLLPDFSCTEVEAILSHCGVDAMFVSKPLYERVKTLGDKLPPVLIGLEDYSLIKAPDMSLTLSGCSTADLPDIDVHESDTASIIYTSGTTGRSKGVELTHKNLIWTAIQGQTMHRLNRMDRCLSILPISHVYEFTIDFTMQMLNGACVYYLGKPPTVSALLPALQKVQPTVICSVPLIMEKIYKNQVLPVFRKNTVIRTVYKFRPLQILLNRAAGKKLKKTFGGYVKFFGIGGAKVDPDVEQFLKDAKFPYAIGYGLTETAPLLAGSGPAITMPGTVGPVMEGVQLMILDPDPSTGIGEVIAKGPNVMKGYYKDPELTAKVFTTSDDSCGAGWFRTGDLGILKRQHGLMRLSLKGRSKNMILGAGGENIYPEDIEFVLNQHPLVTESLVVQDDAGLVALVQLDQEKLEKEAERRSTAERLEEVRKGNISVTEAVAETFNDAKAAADEASGKFKRDLAYKREEIISEIQYFVNSRVNRTSHINRMKQVDSFEKTASQKIKRYLYDLRTKKEKK